MKEHTKPLFNKHKIMTLQNLYFYHSCCDVFKKFKFLIHYLFMIYLISQNEVIEVFTSTHLNPVILSSIEQV